MANVWHANWLEWVFAVIALTSCIISFYSMHDVTKDSSFLLLSNGMEPKLKIILETIATGATWQEFIRLTITGILMVEAGSFLFLEPPPPPYHDLPQSLVGLTGNILICFFLGSKSVIDLLFRHRVRRGIRESPELVWNGVERRRRQSTDGPSADSSRTNNSSLAAENSGRAERRYFHRRKPGS